MKIAVCIRGAVVIDDDVDTLKIDATLNIDATPKNIGGDNDTLLKRLERLVAAYTMSRKVASV